jgi:hypothetical protein
MSSDREERTLVQFITELTDAMQQQLEIHQKDLHKQYGRFNPVYNVLKKYDLVLPVGHVEECLQEGVDLDSLYLPQH